MYSYFRNQLPSQIYARREVNVLSVSGEGKVQTEPNMGFITIGVITENPQLQTAQAENNRISTNVIAAILNLGIARNRIQTVEFRIDNAYDYVEGKQIFRGYEVRHLLEVEVRDIEKIGVIVDAVIAAGANIIYNIRFDTTARKEKYHEALAQAVKDAQKKAGTLARALGVSFALIPFEVTEAQTEIAPIPYQAFTVQKVASTPIQPGTLEIEAVILAKFAY
ncbi:SIMPL domain-containing protein [Caldibacillus lycopersici]|uniref:SIMPL domain-containing protein n=1 Tax=Perspicuibacillus lycopersici TaxID=1325689 RepID=A0AAE3IW52_9BACI|nr:SIMPL domain-containing protein [Perspicuibacillus lycopersici]MCU9614496.1 SIMPL domain-containing protein [Perspicuibacillus lycopersici]